MGPFPQKASLWPWLVGKPPVWSLGTGGLVSLGIMLLVVIYPMCPDSGRCPQKNRVGGGTLQSSLPAGGTDTKQLVLRGEAAPEEGGEGGFLHCNPW